MRLNVIRIAQNLQLKGFNSRQVFGFMVNNTDHVAPLIFAAFCLACPIAPVHSLLSKEEIVQTFMKTKPSVVFCDAVAYHRMNEALKDLKVNVKVFILGEAIDDVETIESLLIETGTESDFV